MTHTLVGAATASPLTHATVTCTHTAVLKVDLRNGTRVVGQLLVSVIHYFCHVVESLLEAITPADTYTQVYPHLTCLPQLHCAMPKFSSPLLVCIHTQWQHTHPPCFCHHIKGPLLLAELLSCRVHIIRRRTKPVLHLLEAIRSLQVSTSILL